jgi:NAD(P)-dependent dehydrogenase (short-subunit alcohol dehydrogenase family)
MEIHFSANRVLVTGGGSGIGRVIAETFARDGVRVHVCDVDEQALANLKAQHANIKATLADVSKPQDVGRLFDDAVQSLGGLDVLVNNAGIAGPTAPAENVSLQEWEHTLAVNITGQFSCVQKAIPLIKAAGGGSIVNISSAAIWKGGFPRRTPYATSKVAVIGFTQTLAMEVGPSNIRVNAVLPGAVIGDRLNRVIEARARETGESVEEIFEKSVAASSMRTAVSEQEVANLVCFLCSDEARPISGQTISVCGNFEGHHGVDWGF